MSHPFLDTVARFRGHRGGAKPHIYFRDGRWFASHWSITALGYGNSPAEAYDNLKGLVNV